MKFVFCYCSLRKPDSVGVRVGLRCRLGRRHLPIRCRCAPPLRQGIRRDLLQGEEGGRGLVRRSPARPRALAVRQGTSSGPQQHSALPVVSTQSLTIYVTSFSSQSEHLSRLLIRPIALWLICT